MDDWINIETPSTEMCELLEWCDCFMGGVDLTISYM